jgi:adenylate kinase
MNRGELVPDAVVWEVAREALEHCEFDNFILDGFPRTIQQADWLDEDMIRVGGELSVVSLEVPLEVILERLSKRRLHRVTGEVYHLDLNPPPADVDPDDLVQRKDDTPKAIELRLKLYEEETAPIKRHYAALDALIEVDGVGDTKTVADRIVDSLSL